MKLKLWGVRGSKPKPGPKTVEYGGNTSCYQITTTDGQQLIFDAGTGLCELGEHYMENGFGAGKGEAKIFLSHVHWDHIQGFPFFEPAFRKGNKFEFFGERKEVDETGQRDYKKSLEEIVRQQQDYPNFPAPLDVMQATFKFNDVEEGTVYLNNPVAVLASRLNHPNGVLAYKVINEGKIFVYTGDNEHDGEVAGKRFGPTDQKLIQYTRNADVLLIDAQYTPEEYNPARHGLKTFPKIGWGHSTYEKAVEIGVEAEVKTVILTHHEPKHTDAMLDKIYEQAQEHMQKYAAKRGKKTPKLLMAKEGMELEA
ncbi:MAG: MBL fold metallo-hydrolase [Candidatus Aenigmarchaeota archaeon]|nr:MBL fold metallo-hydrolase [Candidatus Aenigmarchaeota archaeon]